MTLYRRIPYTGSNKIQSNTSSESRTTLSTNSTTNTNSTAYHQSNHTNNPSLHHIYPKNTKDTQLQQLSNAHNNISYPDTDSAFTSAWKCENPPFIPERMLRNISSGSSSLSSSSSNNENHEKLNNNINNNNNNTTSNNPNSNFFSGSNIHEAMLMLESKPICTTLFPSSMY